MTVGAHPQKLQIRPAHGLNQSVVGGTLLLRIFGQAVGNMAVFRGNIHMVKQILPHEKGIALLMIRAKPHIFIQINGPDAGKVQRVPPVFIHQIPVQPHRAAAGGQSQNRVRFQDNLRRQNAGCLPADIVVIFGTNDFHDLVSFRFLFSIALLPPAVQSRGDK